VRQGGAPLVLVAGSSALVGPERVPKGRARKREARKWMEAVRRHAAAARGWLGGAAAGDSSALEHEEVGEESLAADCRWCAFVGEEVGEEAPVGFTGALTKGSWAASSSLGSVGGGAASLTRSSASASVRSMKS
jgi:hypothetical protein